MEEKIFECPPSEHLQPCFVHLNWDAAVDHSAAANFESTLSSIVSSPSAATPPPHENLVLRELIGRLGSICNSGELSPRTSRYGAAATSCYNTPLNSPPKLNLSGLGNPMAAPPHLFNGDPEFAERAARLSCFGGGGGSFSPQIGISRVSSSQSLMAAPPEDPELGSSREEKIAGRKRKTPAKGKAKEDQNSKRSKSEESAGAGEDDGKPPANSDSGDDKGSNSKPPEPPKQDFIHVRARRGQATDSHSLAERVRREKISQRMKFLQDLVPGCNKVTGKALMLDEIINYVQSLQRQVEFLSMKLATVNPRLDFNVESLLPKGINHPIFPSAENLSAAFPFASPEAHLQSIIAGGAFENHHHQHHHSLAGFMDASSQLPAFWDDELHSVVQMGSSQNQEPALSSQSFHGDGNGIHPGSLSATHMTIQL